ncbi:MAG: hypothetical protein BGO37_09950 [Cellulomonas sp. 73-92]|uniref:hypothetical protein n=1 Tax=Cellulomonas sp. 73-92 TaxID=1895740 RepID=UPI00092A4CD8|nr:hypothetical protein [Cellulomonas sp. 73-92]OJV83560.1 MAG: hypothetical protein BGO37_09950 [Cellulomonas sp. 73-92]
MTVRLDLWSASAATDAAWAAASDVAELARRLGITYRLVGGIAVTLLTHVHGVEDRVPERETADADMGVPRQVLADTDLVGALRELRYEQEAGNRFRRTDGHNAVIDVLTVSQRDRQVESETFGDLTVDAIPGMHVAMMLPATEVEVDAYLRDGTRLAMTLDVTDVRAALVMKAFAYRLRFAANDARDVWRLLEAADGAGLTADDWPAAAGARTAAAHLWSFFGQPGGAGAATASRRPVDQARIRLLMMRLVPDVQPSGG